MFHVTQPGQLRNGWRTNKIKNLIWPAQSPDLNPDPFDQEEYGRSQAIKQSYSNVLHFCTRSGIKSPRSNVKDCKYILIIHLIPKLSNSFSRLSQWKIWAFICKISNLEWFQIFVFAKTVCLTFAKWKEVSFTASLTGSISAAQY